jgi:quercetin dioxygenase-like cupin family protein
MNEMARVLDLAGLPREGVAAGVARSSLTAGETQWMDAEALAISPGASIGGHVPDGSDAYFFVVEGAVSLDAAGQTHTLPLQASAVLQERTEFTLTGTARSESLVLQVVAPPKGAPSKLAGFAGGAWVRERRELPRVDIPEQKKVRFYIASKDAAASDRGHAMIVHYEKDTLTPLHYHPDAESMFVLLDGEIRFVVDGREVIVRPGQAAVFRAGDRHSLRCAEGTTTASFLEFHIPAAFSTVKE